MPSLQEFMIEDCATTPTAPASRQGWWWLAGVMIGCTICVPVFVMGAGTAHQLPFDQFVAAVFVGGTLAAAIALMTGIVGQRTGLPTAMLAKIAFGSRGAILANGAMALASIGWFGIQTNIFSVAFVQLAQQVWGLSLNLTLVTILSGLVMSTTAIIGFRALGKLSYIAVPLLIVLLVLPLYLLYVDGKLAGVATHAVTDPLGFGTVIAIVGGAYSFCAIMPDVTRFMRDTRSTFAGIFANYILAYPLLLILTGSLAIVVLFLSTWTTNDANVYTGALSVNMFVPDVPRWQVAAGVGVVGTLFAVLGIFEHFTAWLIFTGNLFAPMAGVYVVDYWTHRARYHNLGAPLSALRLPQIIAWLGGLGIGLLTTAPENMGLGLFTLTTVPMVDAMAAAAILQVGMARRWR